MPIRLQVLGSLRAFSGGDKLDWVPGHRLRSALLVYLILEGETTRERIAALLWPEQDDEHARHALNQTLYLLRQALGADWLEGQGEVLGVATRVDCDAVAFEGGVERGDYAGAVALYGGPFLDGLNLVNSSEWEAWVDRQRARFERLHRKARRAQIGHLIDEGKLSEATTAARVWVALEPFDDEAQHRLVELLAAGGQRQDALEHYAVYERALAADGLEPLEETKALVERLRTGEAVVGPSAMVQGHAERAADAPPSASLSMPREGPRRPLVLAMATLAILGLLLTVGVIAFRPGPGTIAVETWEYLSGPAEEDYLRRTMPGEVASQLAAIKNLTVIDLTKGPARIPSTAFLESLNADLFLRGLLWVSGDSVVVQWSLLTRSSRLRSSGRVVQPREDFVWLQFDVASQIAESLNLELTAAGERQAADLSNVDTAAVKLYERGMHQLEQLEPSATALAVDLLNEALEIAPLFARGWGALAFAHCQRLQWFAGGEEPAVVVPACREAADRALALDPDVADARYALGYLAGWHDWRWADAEQEFRHALEAAPDHLLGRTYFANFLTWMGRLPEAEALARGTVERFPFSPLALNELEQTLFLQGEERLDEAVSEAFLSLEIDPEFPQSLMLYAEGMASVAGQPDSARAMVKRLMQLRPDLPAALMYGGRALLAAGDTAGAEALWRRLEARADSTFTSPGLLFRMALHRGDPARALDYIEEACRVRDAFMITLNVHSEMPLFAAVVDEPRFRAVMEKLAFPARAP